MSRLLKVAQKYQWKGKPIKNQDGELYYNNKKVNLGYNWTIVKKNINDLIYDLAVNGYPVGPVVKDGHRTSSNFISHSVALIDIDDGMTLEELINDDFYKEHAAGFYTSPSHTDEHHKFRVIFELETDITDVEDMRYLYIGLMMQFKAADPACKDGVRLFNGTVNAAYHDVKGNVLPDTIKNQLIQNGKQLEEERNKQYENHNVVHRELTDERKQLILDLLQQTYVGEYQQWRDIGWGLQQGGFDLADFQYVTTGMMNQKSSSDAATIWKDGLKSSSGRKITMGTVIHFIKEHYGNDWDASLRQNVVKPEPIEKETKEIESFESIIEAYDSIDRHGIILAGTGVGKSHSIANKIIELVNNNQKCMVIVQGKEAMVQLVELLQTLIEWDVDNMDDDLSYRHIHFIEASGALNVGKDKSEQKVPRRALCVITHFTYAGRWGDSQYLYKILEFIDETTTVLIDEVDAYIDSLTLVHEFGVRTKRQVINGVEKDTRIQKCLLKSGSGNCSQCFAHHLTSYEYTYGEFHTPEFIKHWRYSNNINYVDESYYDYTTHNKKLDTFKLGTNEITVLEQTPESEINLNLFYSNMEDEDGEKTIVELNRDTTIRDMMMSSFRPTIHRPFIVLGDKEVSTNQMREWLLGPDGKSSINNMEHRDDIYHPVYACNVLTFVGIDRKPLLLMRESRKLVCYTATLSSSANDYLNEVVPGIETKKIIQNDKRKMNKIIFIGMNSNVSIHDLNQGLLVSKHPILKFVPTKQKAYHIRSELVKNGYNAILFEDRLSKTEVADESKITQKHISYVVSYSLGSLGRGINLPQYRIVNVDLGNHKPTCAYTTDSIQDLLMSMLDTQLSTVVQNAGRILRWNDDADDGVRIIFVEGLDHISTSVQEGLNISSSSIKDYLEITFGELTKEIEVWVAPKWLTKEGVIKYITKIFDNESVVTTNPPSAPHHLIEMIKSIGKKTQYNESIIAEHAEKWVDVSYIQDVFEAQDYYISKTRSKSGGAKKSNPSELFEKRKLKINGMVADGKNRSTIKRFINYNKMSEDEKNLIDKYLDEKLGSFNF